jgi:hypothetical protein
MANRISLNDLKEEMRAVARGERKAAHNIEKRARELFDARPHNYSVKRPGENRIVLVPDWNIQPDNVKDVFRRLAAQETKES